MSINHSHWHLKPHVSTQALQPGFLWVTFIEAKGAKLKELLVSSCPYNPSVYPETLSLGKKSFFVPYFLTHSYHGNVAGLNVVILAWASEVVRGSAAAQICPTTFWYTVDGNKSIWGQSRMKVHVKSRDGPSVCGQLPTCTILCLCDNTDQKTTTLSRQ